MGHSVSHFWWGGDPDEVNPISGLSRRQIYAVQKSWAPVYANPIDNGGEFFKRLFRASPETKEFFKSVRKLPEEEFLRNNQFRAHVYNLMTSLNSAIINLHQPEVVAAMMNKIGESHYRRHIKENHFYGLKEIIMKMVMEVLNLNEDTMTAWDKMITFLYKHIFETLKTPEEL